MVQQQSFPTSRIIEARSSRRQVVKWIAGGTAIALSGVLASPARFAAAQATPTNDISAYPEVTITAENAASGDGYTFGTPDSFPTGYVKVTLVNNSTDADHHAIFMRTHRDVTPDDFIEKAIGSSNPGEFASMATSIGGPGSIGPGQSATVIMNLEEGLYVLTCEIPGPDGTPHYKMGMITEVDAKPDGTPVTTPPEAETMVDLADFEFDGLPDTLPAGQHIWQVHNKGPEPHEMAVNLLASDITPEALYHMLAASEAPATPGATAAASPPASTMTGPPFTGVAGTAPMDPDQTIWAVLDLTAGEYATICFIPDPKTGKPHFMLGMYDDFTVK